MSDKRLSWIIEKVGIDYPERRAYKRVRAMIPGRLSHAESAHFVHCVILDISLGGAKVRLDSDDEAERLVEGMAQRFHIATDIDLPIKLVWRDGNYAGLRFLCAPRRVAAALEKFVEMYSVKPDKSFVKMSYLSVRN